MSTTVTAPSSKYEGRLDRVNELEKIDKEIEKNSIALRMTSDADPELPDRLYQLGRAHTTRFERTGVVDDINKAIEYQSRAIALTPNGHPDLPKRVANLGISHKNRFQHLGDQSDLEKAIEYQSRAVSLTPDGHPDLPMCLTNLGVSHSNRYDRLGKLGDLDMAIKCVSRAISWTPKGHPDLQNHLANLGASYTKRYRRLGERDDIDKAIEYGTSAAELTREGHLSLPAILTNLGGAHYHRYQELGELNDLDQAIKCAFRIVGLTPEGHPRLPSRLVNLGKSHSERYGRLGELADLEKAIECKSRAVSLTPNDHPDLPDNLSSLGGSHSARFERLGELADLEKAIECESRAVSLTPNDHPDLPGHLESLGHSYSKRYERLRELADLEKALDLQTRSVSITPEAHLKLPGRLASLAASHNHRHTHSGELGDLDKAIKYGTRAVALTPEAHPGFPFRLKGLAVFHTSRYCDLRDLQDFDYAIELLTRVFGLLPAGHPYTPILHFDYAITYLIRYRGSNDPSYLKVSLDAFRQASRAPFGSPRARFNHAFVWARQSVIHHSLNPVEAYQTAISLLPQFVWLGATAHQRYEDLATIETLAGDAACAAIRFSSCSLALEWLEQARCVVWNQSLMLRTPLDELQNAHPTLATRLQNIAKQLYDASSRERESQDLSSDSLTTEQEAQQHRRLAMEYEKLIAQARELPGFTNFLQPMKTTGLVRAARYGPVAVINTHKDRCDALIILPGQDYIHHVPLPDFTVKDAQTARLNLHKSIRSKGLRERGAKFKQAPGQADPFGSVLAGLWYKVVKPVLDFLGYTNKPTKDNLPHITWCPTGIVSFLPLHAAGDYDQPESRVFDFAISSYTPTLSALLTLTPNTWAAGAGVLAIGQEITPGCKPLPSTTRELGYIQTHARNTAPYTRLMNEQATKSAVLDAMDAHDWVHLACHASQNINNPTKSSFFLHDGTLDLATINRRSFKNKGLAFLSACQTAKGDENLPDEAIHLASGMLMAGYSSVIATMWSVYDVDTPIVTNKLYEQLMRNWKLGNGEAGKALHNAVAELREKVGEKAFERWVPYIHIGS